jgi:hypothetical protein
MPLSKDLFHNRTIVYILPSAWVPHNGQEHQEVLVANTSLFAQDLLGQARLGFSEQVDNDSRLAYYARPQVSV